MYGRLKLTITHTHTRIPTWERKQQKDNLKRHYKGIVLLGYSDDFVSFGTPAVYRRDRNRNLPGERTVHKKCTGNEFSFDARYLDAIETAVFLSLHHSPCSTQHGQHGSPLQVRITVTAGVRPPKPGIFISPFLLSSLQHTSEPVGKRMLLGA